MKVSTITRTVFLWSLAASNDLSAYSDNISIDKILPDQK
jgi:hypothetical protein